MSAEIVRLARDVAAVVPAERNRATSTAKVPWSLINALRDELDRAGVEWRERNNELAEVRTLRRRA